MTLKELENTVAHLPPEELSQFREWFLEFDAANWDRQIEADVAAGRLDKLADKAIREHFAGDSTPLGITSLPAISGAATTRFQPTSDGWLIRTSGC